MNCFIMVNKKRNRIKDEDCLSAQYEKKGSESLLGI